MVSVVYKRCVHLAVLVLLLAGYSFAQDMDMFGLEPLDEASKESQSEALPSQPPPKILSPNEIPKGFSSQIKVPKKEPEPVVEAPKKEEKLVAPAPAPTKSPAPVPIPKPAAPPKPPKYAHYEVYLDSIESIAKQMLPAREKTDAMIEAIKQEQPAPMSAYEKQSSYEQRIANVEKNRALKIAKLEQQYNTQQKRHMDRLSAEIRSSDDIQPNWEETLLQNATDIDEYQKRIDKFKDKITSMNYAFIRINDLLKLVNVSQSDMEKLDNKNLLFIKRLERACELMDNYKLQQEAKILASENKGGGITLGDYDPEKEQFPINARDLTSKVPYDFYGYLKAQPYLAQEIGENQEGLAASVDYVNYPFIFKGEKIYPGAKELYIYHKEREISTEGVFKSLEGYENLEGYVEWAMRADSLINGKVKIPKLDESYAMKKVKVGPPFWTAKKIFIASMFAASAVSLGTGIWQNGSVNNKTKTANKLYETARNSAIDQNRDDYNVYAKAYEDKIDSRYNSVIARNSLYLAATGFAAVGVVYIVF